MIREDAIRILRKEIECMSHTKCEDCILEKVCDPMITTPSDTEYREVYEMAIIALEQEPCEDAVSRQSVKDWFCTNYCSEHNKCEHFEKGDCNAMIELFAITTVNPQEPTNEIVQKAYEDGKKDGYVQAKVEQKSKTGRWLKHPTEEDYSVCSRCGIGCRRKEYGKNADGTKYIDIYSYRFCPYCGARMEREDD